MSALVDSLLQQQYGVVEASAGTGKTFIIQELALRLLKSGVPLPQILILTYTEAATSELRQRIRARILEDLRKGPAPQSPPAAGRGQGESERKRLQEAAEQYDAAAIHTIHGFCQRALTRHAFENQQPFTMEVIDDRPLYRRFLREEQRQLWPQLLGRGTFACPEVLADFLSLSGYPGDEESSWEAAVIEVARSWRPERDTLSPVPPEDLAALIAEESRKIEPVRRALLAFLQAPANSELTPKLFDERVQQVQCLSARTLKALRDYIVAPLCPLTLPSPQGGEGGVGGHLADDRERLVALVKRFVWQDRAFLQNWYAKGFSCLEENPWTKGGTKSQREALPEQTKRLEQLVSALRELDGLKQFFGCLATFTASRLRQKVDAYKEAHGLLSFEDMLTRLERALDPEKNPAAPQLLEALRGQYKAALVDEFQDTDPVQWSILRRIFIGEKNERVSQRLFVIGDPKQAIYGFRGADVTTYQMACQHLRNIQGEARKSPPLDVSYRSTPELLGALNRLFQARTQEPWFGPASGIAYKPIGVPQQGRKIELHYPARERAAFNLVDLGGAESASAARKEMARFVAGEIARLLDWHGSPGPARPRFVAERNGEKKERSLEAGDIAILVDFRSAAAIFEKALDEYGPLIPHTFYKKEGLYQSEEARHLSILLQGIAEPADHAAFRKVLLTHFFRVRAEELFPRAFAELPPEHPVRQLFGRWRLYAQRRNWARLFQSILEDTGVLWCYQPTSTTVLSAGGEERGERSEKRAWTAQAHSSLLPPHSSLLVPPDMERRGTNYQHILEELEDAARRSHLDFDGVRALLEARRLGLFGGSEESGLHRLETEDPRVRIMTIHASKGLEFPVVFVCAGFTESRIGKLFTKYHARGADGLRRPALVYDFGPDRKNDSQEEEKEEETRRLYYVALTRAQCLLYAPYLPLENETGGKLKAGPACTLLYPAMEAGWPVKYDGTFVARVAGAHAEAQRPQSEESRELFSARSASLREKDEGPEPRTPSPAPDGWLDPLGTDRRYITAADTLQSFSALSQSRPRPSLVLADEKQRDWDEEAALSTQSSDVLPGGRHVGLALHEILEQIDFRAVKGAGSWEELLQAPNGVPYQDLLGAALEKHGLSRRQASAQLAGDPYAQALTRLVWTALRAALPDFPGGELRLCDLDEADRLHELEFNLPLPSWRELHGGSKDLAWEHCKRALQAAWPALRLKDPLEHASGYLNGVIDLVFRAPRGPRCRYYVLDWKSNSLAAGYGPAELAACMRENNYDLQRGIYTLALLRWLAQCRISPEQFGGVYYVFLRGVDAADPGAGFFRDFKTPRHEDLSAELFVWLNRELDFGLA